MKMLSKKPALVLLLTMSTASFYFAQSTQDTLKNDTNIDEVILTGVADIAKDRKTPVAVSTIKEAQIVEKLGNQEFPEILNTTPSVYSTKAGGGFGDGKTVIRGFTQENIAVMVNGMPVNDMENGSVYWSNWLGMSDVTSAMQVQRGLGSSKLAIASVGGTINILTRAADKKQGGIVSIGVANDDYHKSLFAYNTGKSEKGWASSFLLSRTAGSMFVDGTKFEGYNYYFALGYKKPGGKHDFQFTITGAPQWHNQRSSYVSIQNYIKYNSDNDGTPDIRYNSDWGYRNGEQYSNRVNYFHKPVMSLNWDWNINEKSKLNSVFYASFGRGGGTGDLGTVKVGTTTYSNINAFPRTAEGLINYDGLFVANAAIDANSVAARSTLVRRSSINAHNWFGAIISYNHKINDNLNFTIGTDDRYYYGYHYQVISDFYGANGYKDATNQNFFTTPNNVYTVTPRVITNSFSTNPSWNPFGGKLNNQSDMVAYNNDGEVLWYGGFGQLEYSNDKLSAFVQGAVSNQSFQRIDHFILDGRTLLNGQIAGTNYTQNGSTVTVQPSASNPALNTKTGFKDIFGYNVKAGANYNINDYHNVFANIGYYSKQPFLNSVYPNQKNYLNPNLTNEKIFGIEAGYGFRASFLTANVNIYRTSWKDRFLRRGGLTIDLDGNPATTNDIINNAYANIQGITEIHQGIELEAMANVNKYISLTAMASLGDYYYKGNATSNTFDESNQPITSPGASSATTTLYLDKVKVGNAAHRTLAGGVVIKPTSWISVDGTYRAVSKLYANINPANFLNETAQNLGALELPTFGLLDVGLTLKIKLNDPKQYFTLRGNIYNILNKVYIAESNTNTHKDMTKEQFAAVNPTLTAAQVTTSYAQYQSAGYWNGINQTNQVWFGAGRTWAATLSFNF